MVKDRSKHDEMAKIMLDKWGAETVIPAHGDIIRGYGLVQSVLRDHLE